MFTMYFFDEDMIIKPAFIMIDRVRGRSSDQVLMLVAKVLCFWSILLKARLLGHVVRRLLEESMESKR